LLGNEALQFAQLLYSFASPPLYSTDYKNGFGTLYSSIYLPKERIIEIRWPDSNWILGFEHFTEGHRVIQYHPTGAMTLQAI